MMPNAYKATYWFYIIQDGLTIVTGACSTRAIAEREANHYAMMYGQDGEVKVKYRLTVIKDTP